MAILNSNLNAEHKFGAELPRGLRRNRRDQASIDQAPRSNIDRFEQTWESTTCADRILQISVSEDHRLAIIKVGCHNRERDAQIFKML